MSDALSMIVRVLREGTAAPVLLALFGIAGCAGHATAEREQARTSVVPPRLAEEEARLAEALESAEDESASCPDRCRSSEAVCEAAEHVCTIVASLRDVSLAPRCDRARRACASAREVVSGCGCAASR